MQVTQTLNEGLKRGYQITVTAAELEAKVAEKLVEAQPDIEIEGLPQGQGADGDPAQAVRAPPSGRRDAGTPSTAR